MIALIQRKSIIAMIGTDGLRHTTLWNGSKFLDDTNYLNDKPFEVFVRELCFFEL